MRLEIDIPEHHYNNIMALDSVSLGRVPYKGIIMYTINAIKHGRVLEQEPSNSENPNNSTTKNDLGVDVISREQAINACHNFAIGVLDDYYEKCLKQWIIDLPSVIPQEPRWIPVSERLPEPNRLVLCYITTGATKTYFLALRNEYYDDWEEGIGGSRLLGKDLGYKVIAWMPLPKPYEPQESEDQG